MRLAVVLYVGLINKSSPHCFSEHIRSTLGSVPFKFGARGLTILTTILMDFPDCIQLYMPASVNHVHEKYLPLIQFYILIQKHRLWVLVRTAWAEKKLCILCNGIASLGKIRWCNVLAAYL